MSPRLAVAVMLLSYVATFVVACALLPVEPTALELHQILEREYGKELDRTRDSDLPGAVQALLLEQNLADFATSERSFHATERWLQRALVTSILGSVLGIAVVIAVRRALRPPSVPPAVTPTTTAPSP